MNNNLLELSNKYVELLKETDKVEHESSYYESVLLKYKGVVCYVDNLSLYFGKVKLRVNDEESDRFEGGKKVIELTVEEFDNDVRVVK